MKLRLILLSVMILFSVTAYSQMGRWKNYSQMRYINDITEGNNGIWAATTGGVFFYSFNDNTFKNFTSTEGLKSSVIYSAAKDKYGRIWFGAEDGSINIYNPQNDSWKYNVVIYNSGKLKRQINKIVMYDSIAYICSDFGISIININTLEFGDTYNKLGIFGTDTKVNSVVYYDTLWAATERGIAVQKSNRANYLTPDSWNNFSTASGINSQNVFSVVKYKDTIYAGTGSGVAYLSGSTWTPVFSLGGTSVYELKIINDTMYLATDKGLYRYAKGNFNQIFSLTNDRISSVLNDKGNLYCATTSGLLKYSAGKMEYLYPNGPTVNLFPSIAVDDNGALWAASGTDLVLKGFYRLKDNQWKNFLTNEYPVMGNDAYHKVSRTSGNTIWMNAWGMGLIKIKNDSILVRYNKSNSGLVGIPNAPEFIVTRGVAEDSKGNIWILQYLPFNSKPLVKLSKDSIWESFTNELNSNAVNVTDIVIDQNDTKFIINDKLPAGIYYFNETGALTKRWGFISRDNGLNSEVITCMAVDKLGELWAGSSVGINILMNPYRPESQITSVYSMRNQRVNCIVVDGLNYKWVGTQNGVFVLSPDGIDILAQYNTKNSPLFSDNIQSIAIDNKTGIVYIGTANGLSTLQTTSIEPKTNFDKLDIYPNPFMEGKHTNIIIDGLVANSTLKIFSVDGRLVRNIITPGGRVAFWDGRDERGNAVDSGIYFVTAYSEKGDKTITGKVAIIKR